MHASELVSPFTIAEGVDPAPSTKAVRPQKGDVAYLNLSPLAAAAALQRRDGTQAIEGEEETGRIPEGTAVKEKRVVPMHEL